MIEVDAQVARILSASEIAINVGDNKLVCVGDRVVLWNNIEIRDPESNDVLGTVRRERLELKVELVQELFSIARVEIQTNNFLAGMFSAQTKFITGMQVPDEEHVPLVAGDEVTVYATGDGFYGIEGGESNEG